MKKFNELKKAASISVAAKMNKLAVLGNCATQMFAKAVQGSAKLAGVNLDVFDADYNQIEALVFNPGSELYQYKPDEILFFIASDKLYEEFLDTDLAGRKTFADIYMQKILSYWDCVQKNLVSVKIIQLNFTEIDDRGLGNYSAKIEDTFTFQIRKLNFLLQEKMAERKYVYPVDLLAIQNKYGIDFLYDPALYYNAKLTVNLNALPVLAKNVTDILLALSGRIKKCVVLDLDNTLWGGVIGDDGLGGIEIGELGRGHAFSDFQRWLKQLKDFGILLAVCSKNNEDTAKEPFEKHDEMILRLVDIAIFVANWNDKASNIKHIQQVLNIGMDSLIFVDDNPFERNLIKSALPEVTVPDLPEDPALYLSYLQSLNLFETASYSKETASRTEQYQAEANRVQFSLSFGSIDDYLKSLEMCGTCSRFEPLKYSRIAQLSQRSNQFNLRTIRYTENDIKNIAESSKFIPLYFTLKDKFGDYGLVSVVIIEKRENKAGFIDTFIMSCRVLKRGMEEFVINKIVEVAKAGGLEKLYAEYISTAKNKMVENFYLDMGFNEIADKSYELDLGCYKNRNTFVSGEKHE